MASPEEGIGSFKVDRSKRQLAFAKEYFSYVALLVKDLFERYAFLGV